MIEAKVIADSVSDAGKRLTTFQLRYPRFIHSEMLTHRVFSRNASSSRAIPVHRMIEMVSTEPAMPIHWGKNQAGMQAKEELSGEARHDVQALWLAAAKEAAAIAGSMMDLGVHKQVANRILEPFQHISVVLTSTEYENWFELRDHEDAQPEIRELAIKMKAAMAMSRPRLLRHGEWHLPYVTVEDMEDELLTEKSLIEVQATLLKVSAARCCRVSYLKHDGQKASIEEELKLCDRLVGSRPLHASPFEHQATPDEVQVDPMGLSGPFYRDPASHGNFVGWIQHRKLIERDVWSMGEIA